MTQGRPMHDCPYCGRTKFADETLPCCVDPDWQEHCAKVAAYLEYVAKTGKEPPLSPEAEAQVERAMRRFERRGRTEWVNDGNGRGWQHQIDIIEWSSQ